MREGCSWSLSWPQVVTQLSRASEGSQRAAPLCLLPGMYGPVPFPFNHIQTHPVHPAAPGRTGSPRPNLLPRPRRSAPLTHSNLPSRTGAEVVAVPGSALASHSGVRSGARPCALRINGHSLRTASGKTT